MPSVLDLFSPPVARWFHETFGGATPPQEWGWPHIARGENVLILAPTGSGKTLAAFLYAIDELVTRRTEEHTPVRGVHAVYVSPLRALAADIERNLEGPLAGIRACAGEMGVPIADLRVGVRTGDTSPAERQRMLRRPPDLLITTPESLHLLLTAKRSRETLRQVRYVIVDEIHTLCGEKRGSFLALLLERLEHVAGRPIVRIGLSATQRPLERVARFLGGYDERGEPRPVSMVDCGMRKDLDLAVVSPVPDMRLLPRPDGQAPSVWPAIYERLLQLAAAHTSTLIFANNRRAVERIAAEMNRLAGHRMVRAHHGSVSKEYRREIEEELKAGRLPALVATASLELGIDMGAIDLVCQVESPTSVASGLQRVGRAGHVFRRTSVGRMIPKTRGDLLRMAAMARAMLRGEISEVHVPENPLDVLAQQVVAMVAVEDWSADALYARVRQADPFHRLPRSSFDEVLEMISGGYTSPSLPLLRARLVWERGTGRLSALPGALHAAIASGGTIPDTGQYAMVLEDGKTRLGELDEEFVFERRVGDTFVLGTGRWKILEVRHDRVVVAASASDEAQLPFWKGEGLGHDAEFGERWGAFVAECARRHAGGDLVGWLTSECALDADAARNLSDYVGEQAATGVLPDDRTILIDVFPNEMGDLRVGVVSTFGRSFHVALWLAVRAELRRAGHEPPEGIVSNDGILLRPGAVPLDAIVGAIERLGDGEIRDRLTEELRDSPYFALRFRRNAGRALLLPRSQPGRRIPLWLQRLRSHDLLAYASDHPRFPIVAETHREILDDVLPIAVLERFVRCVAVGEARFAVRRGRSPSPFTGALLLDFVGKYMYEADQPIAKGTPVDRDLLDELLQRPDVGDLVGEDSLRTMEERLQSLSAFHRARNGVEIVELLQRIGDLTEAEVRARCELQAIAALDELVRDDRVRRIRPPLLGEERLVASDDVPTYEEDAGASVPAKVLVRYVTAHAGRTEAQILARYPGASVAMGALRAEKHIVQVDLPGQRGAFVDRDVLLGLRRMTLSARRREAEPVSPIGFAAAVLRRQHVAQPLVGGEGLRSVLDQLAGWLVPAAVWPELLEARLENPERIRIEPLVRGGFIEWRGWRLGATRVLGFAPPDVAGIVLPCREGELEGLAARVVEFLSEKGASFLHQIAGALASPPAAADEALWELTWRGWVTNDSLVAAQRAGPGRGRPTPGLGRWSAVAAVRAGDRDDDVCRILRVLLSRYGLLSRELVDRESIELRWSEAYPALSRMEWRGDVERGMYVSDLSGPQFAVAGWRHVLQAGHEETRLQLLHVMDPANLVGDVVPVARAPRRGPGNYVIVRGGQPLVAVEAWARRLVPLADFSVGERREALFLLAHLVRRAGQRPSIRVETWDGVPAAASEVADDLAALGCIRDDQAMVLYRSFRGPA
jgi:ATP-dependent Lhr-like helicase